MALKTTSKWLTVCLHYNEPWEEFLIKAVKPYVDVVLQTGIAERFFFQRSWERGPHIKLWFKGGEYVLENMLKPNLEEHFLQYFDSIPSFLVQPNYPVGFPDAYKWHPNNSVQYQTYEPELEHFGGKMELSLCERQYQASSLMTLHLMKEKAARWTNNEIMGTAIKMHLSLAYSAGLGHEEASLFFKQLSEEWNLKSSRKNAGKSDIQSIETNAEATLRSFKKIFELQKKDLVPYQSALWELFKNYRQVESDAFINWFHINSSASLELSIAIESGKLPLRQGVFSKNENLTQEDRSLYNFLADFVKLTNNRLGIVNKNEGYLFYAISEGLKSMVPSHAILENMAA